VEHRYVSSDFFNEVDEDLRANRWKALARQYLPWVITVAAALLAAYLGVWGWTAWRAHVAAKASEAYDRGLEAMASHNPAQAQLAFEEAAKSGSLPFLSSPYRSIALMQEAGILVEERRTDDAVKKLDDAAKSANNPVLKDLASLKAAFLLMDKTPYSAIENRLKPLTDKKRPLQSYAREALAFAKLQAGRTKEARADFSILSLELNTPEDVRQRASMAKQAIDDGVAQTLPSVVQDAAADAARMPAPRIIAPQAGSPARQAGAASQ
jgi:hypothetical protein